MSEWRILGWVAGCSVGGGVIGSGIGFLIAKNMPTYYSSVFDSRGPDFDPIAVGIGQGLTQGLVGGVVVGLAIPLMAAHFRRMAQPSA